MVVGLAEHATNMVGTDSEIALSKQLTIS
jgi:hypothetical protein